MKALFYIGSLLVSGLILTVTFLGGLFFERPEPFASDLLAQFKEKTPDIFVVGNSIVAGSLNHARFEKKLGEALGRQINVGFLARSATHSGLFYLALKNFIQPTAKPGTPVVLVGVEDMIWNPGYGDFALNHVTSRYQSFMTDHEEQFLQRVGPKAAQYLDKTHHNWWSQPKELKRNITAILPTVLLQESKWIRKRDLDLKEKSGNAAMIDRLLVSVFKMNNFRNLKTYSGPESTEYIATAEASEVLQESYRPAGDALDIKAKATFLSEIALYQDEFPLYFVLSNVNPAFIKNKEIAKQSAALLAEYLPRQGIKFVDMNHRTDIQDPKLMTDRAHYKKGPQRDLYTDALVDQLVQSGLLTAMTESVPL